MAQWAKKCLSHKPDILSCGRRKPVLKGCSLTGAMAQLLPPIKKKTLKIKIKAGKASVLLFVWNRVSLKPQLAWSHYIDQGGLDLTEVSMPLPPGCWEQRHCHHTGYHFEGESESRGEAGMGGSREEGRGRKERKQRYPQFSVLPEPKFASKSSSTRAPVSNRPSS